MLAPALAALTLASAHPVTLPDLFHEQLPVVKRSSLAVLLPQTMPADAQLYPWGGRAGRGWVLGADVVPDCGGANACFDASFTARKRPAQPFGEQVVQLARGRTGRFTPLHCGASCAPPGIEWRERGAVYSIQARVGTRRTEKRILVAMANSAIRRGPR